MTIKLLGYEPLLDNLVFIRDRVVCSDDMQRILLKEIVLPARYKTPSENDVVEYLQRRVEGVDDAAALLLPHNTPQSGRSLLELAIMDLPDKVRRDIRTGDERCIDFVRSHTLAPNIKDKELQEERLFVRYGLIPVDVIAKNQESGSFNDAEWYDAALSYDKLRKVGLGERWNMRLLLSDGELPLQDEVYVLLNHGVHGSKTLDINRIHYSMEEVKNVIDAIYSGLSKTDERAQLRDVSDKVLEELTLQPVLALQSVVKDKVKAHVVDIVNERLRRMGGNGKAFD